MRNYKIKTYAKLRLNYNALFYLSPKNSFIGRQMNVAYMSYEDVKGVARDLGKEFTWKTMRDIFETSYKVSEEEFWNAPILDFFASFNFIQEHFEKLLKNEQRLLASIASIDSVLWKQAEKGRLNKFSSILPLVQLGKIYGEYPFILKDKPYLEIVNLLTIQKEVTEVEREYDKLKNMTR